MAVLSYMACCMRPVKTGENWTDSSANSQPASAAFLWEFSPYGSLFLDTEAMEKYRNVKIPTLLHFTQSERGSEV